MIFKQFCGYSGNLCLVLTRVSSTNVHARRAFDTWRDMLEYKDLCQR